MHQLYILTIGKKEELRKVGYQVVELWECDYDKRFKEDPDFRSLVDSELTNLDPLRPRDALFGGRTNSTKLYQKSMNPPMKKSSTSMCVHSIQLFASTDSFHLVIPPSILKRT